MKNQAVKSIAIIGASYLQLPLVLKAKEMQLRVICFAWEDGAVCAEVADKFYPVSIVEKEEILSICIKEHIDGICTIASDVAAPTVAYVAEKMHLVGNSYTTALCASNKFLMRQAFNNYQIPSPSFLQIDNVEALPLELRFPLIVKPVDRSGSLAVFKVNDRKSLEESIQRALQASFSKQVIIEEFVEGCEISVEFISYKGKHYPLAITDKVTTGAPHFVELEHHQPSSLSADVQNEVNELTIKALNSLGVINGASHTEYKITDQSNIFIIELGARMGGDFIGSHLVPLSTGYDFLKGVIDVALGQFETPQRSLSMASGVYFISQETANLLPILQQNEHIVDSRMIDNSLHFVTCSGERSGYFIYQANTTLKL